MAKDIFHEQVKDALIKDGWVITHDPYPLNYLKKKMEIDLGAEKVIAAEKENFKIAVEIKSFLSHSRLYDFHTALGQFRTYRRIMRKTDTERILFLAIPEDAYDEFFNTPFGNEAIEEENLRILVFNPSQKKVILWIK